MTERDAEVQRDNITAAFHREGERRIIVERDLAATRAELREERIGREAMDALYAEASDERDALRTRADLLERAAAVAMAERDAERAECERWKRVALTHAEKCGTCEGDGVMDVVVGVTSPDEAEVFDMQPCGECGGTGRNDVAALIRDAAAKNTTTPTTGTAKGSDDAD